MGPVFAKSVHSRVQLIFGNPGKSVSWILGKSRDENITRGSLSLMLENGCRAFSPTNYPWVSEDGFNVSTTLLFITLLFFPSKQSIYVTKVQPDGPASFGLVPGDRILEVREYLWPYILSDQCCYSLFFNSDGVKSHNQKPRASWYIIKIRVPIPFTTLSLIIHVNIRLGLDLVWVGIGPKYIAGFEKRERRAGFVSYRESGIRQNLGTGSSGLPFPDPESWVGGVLPYYKPYKGWRMVFASIREHAEHCNFFASTSRNKNLLCELASNAKIWGARAVKNFNGPFITPHIGMCRPKG